MRFLSLLLVAAIAACQPSEDMGSPQSPSATPTFPATITPPVNGENLDATALNVNVETPLQNGVEAARLLTYGGGLRRRVKCSDNNTLVIDPMGAVVSSVGAVWTVVPHLTSSTIDPQTLSGGLANNTRYYVYAAISAGTIVFSVSTTAPDAGLFYKTGDPTYFFISTFITDNSANIVPYTQSELTFSYGNDGVGGYPTPTIVLNAGSAVVSTVVTFGISVPTGAKTAVLFGQINATSAGRYGDIIDAQNSEVYSRCIDAGTIGGFCNVAMSLANGPSVRYSVSNAASQLTLVVHGFTL